ncbi:sulfotransferase 1C2-like isoform X2 [Mercenaria mercenaria]|uniref:sulfotransferase 1C2-like isoform X2 n=1 Tax=Mercenaria mercenaria TaxID=6596 RepID=UPI00234E4540|nr:sulfotransferase 1C2-like isoform X2 [Mercenaria mercenaria]
MEAEYTEVYDLRDAGGGVLYNQMRVDGMRIPTFRKPPGVTAAIFRNIKHLKIREDDILLCTPVKSVMYNSWFDYVLEFEKALNAEPHRIHLVYYEDLKENGVEEIARIAKFLGVPAAVDAELIETINEKCQFKSMKEGKMYSPELAKKMFVDPSKFNIYRKGEIGDWKNHFTVAENEAFDKLYQEKMKTSKLKFRFEPSAK